MELRKHGYRKPKKLRTFNNLLIDIFSINVECGDNFINWIDLTKQKLKERERKLLMIRISEIENIVNNNNSNNNKYNYKISNKLIESLLNVNLFPIIDKWNGININRIKKPLNKFQDYFIKGRNWWDINKQNIIGLSFWIPIFQDIQKVFFL